MADSEFLHDSIIKKVLQNTRAYRELSLIRRGRACCSHEDEDIEETII